jgi:cytochrome P450
MGASRLGLVLLPAGLIAAALLTRLRYLRKLAHIPGPPCSLLLGSIPTMRGPPAFPHPFFTQRHLFLRALHAKYGPVVRMGLPIGRGAMIFFAKAEPMVEPYFKSPAHFPTRPSPPLVLESGLLFVKTGDVSRAHRAALVPALSTRALRHYLPALNRRAASLCDHAQLAAASAGAIGGVKGGASGEGDVEMHRPLSASTMDVIGEVGFGADFECLKGVDSHSTFMAAGTMLLGGMMAMVVLPLPLTRLIRSLPTSWQPRSQQDIVTAVGAYEWVARDLFARARADALAAKTEARGAGDHAAAADAPLAPVPKTFLEALAISDLSYQEAVEEIITLMIAGHETTANTLSWALHLIALHPAEQARAYTEVSRACPANSALEFDSLSALPYVRGCFYESLRLFPTVPSVPRLCERDALIDGVHVPAGTIVLYSITAGARDPAVFTEPDCFVPERHAQAAEGGAAWLPFGAGQRKCIGYRFAELEAIAFLVAILQRFEVLPPQEHTEPPGEYTDITLGPKLTGLYVRLRPRADIV